MSCRWAPQVPIPYPSDIMVRERTILINLEAIRLIITKDQVCKQATVTATSLKHACRREIHSKAADFLSMHVVQSTWP